MGINAEYMGEEIKKRGEDFKYFKDQFGEHPEDRATNEELTEKMAGVTTINDIYAAIKEKVPKLEPIRIPMNQEKAPAEENFDQIVAMLKDTTASCPVIFNCQAGISRTTTAVVCGALVNGKPFTARDPAKVNFHLEINNPEECTTMENEFAEEIKKRGEDFKY